tara:strand:+ start:1677 stop:2234 length:558 start_codon:yes stop_codon:yes gene_type:complete
MSEEIYGEFDASEDAGFAQITPSEEDYTPKYWICSDNFTISKEDMEAFEKALRMGKSSIPQWEKAVKYARTLVHQSGNEVLDTDIARQVAVALLCRLAQGSGSRMILSNYWGWVSNDQILESSVEGTVIINGITVDNGEKGVMFCAIPQDIVDGSATYDEIDKSELSGGMMSIPFSKVHYAEVIK